MNLETVPNQMDAEKFQCRAIIETPKGSRNKFDYEPDLESFSLGGLLPEGMSFPFDFGFIPSTKGEDGDPLDVLVMMDAPTHVGCVLDVRLVGVIEADQIQGKKKFANDRLVAVGVHSYNHDDVTSIDQVNKSVMKQLEQFFVRYNESRGKKFVVKGLHGPKRALKCVVKGCEAAKKDK